MKRPLLRFGLHVLTRIFYRLHVNGRENAPASGPALYVSNHLSYGDPVLISACAPRPIRFLMWRELHDDPRFQWFFRAMQAIPVAANDSRRQLVTSINQAREALERGEQVGVFAEGEISRVAQLLGFRKGLESIAKGLPVPIIPVHLDGLWGSMFSYERGRFFRKMPRHIPYHVTVSFGKPLSWSTRAPAVRQAVMELGATAFEQRMEETPTLHAAFLKIARKNWNARCVDNITRGEMAVNAFLLARRWRQQIQGKGPVGVKLVPSAEFVLAHLALAWMGKTAVSLDPALSPDETARLRSELGLSAIVSGIPTFGGAARALATFALRCLPVGTTTQAHPARISMFLGEQSISFTYPKIQAQITGLQEVLALGARDTMTAAVGLRDPLIVVPALWWPLLSGAALRYAPAPSEKGTIDVTQGESSRFSITHNNAFVHPMLGGIGSVNTTDVRYGNEVQKGNKPGSLGRPLPGVAVRVVDPETQNVQAPGAPGKLLVKTAYRDWVDTGETAKMDDDGFLERCNLSASAHVPMNERSNQEKP